MHIYINFTIGNKVSVFQKSMLSSRSSEEFKIIMIYIKLNLTFFFPSIIEYLYHLLSRTDFIFTLICQ